MKIKKIAFLGVLALSPFAAVACNTMPENENTIATTTPTQGGGSMTTNINTTSEPSKNPVGLKDISSNSTFKTFSSGDNNTLLAVNEKNELVRFHNNVWTVITNNVHEKSPILESRGRISAVDKNGNYLMVQNNTVTNTNLKVSLQGGFVHLGAANILVVERNSKFYLARVELSSPGTISNINTNIELPPDAQPVQIGIGSSNNSDGPDIAVLAKPSTSRDYSHGVLGDNIEAKSIIVVERHNMNDVRATIELTDTSVFEDARLLPIKINNKYYLSTIQSGENNQGARVVIIGQSGRNLQIIGKGPQLPNQRWMSLSVFNETDLFSNHTPHIGGATFKYDLSNLSNIKTQQFSNKISTHKINTHILSVAAASSKYLFAPAINFSMISAINLQTKETETIDLKAQVVDVKLDTINSAYVLLNNGKIVIATFK